MELATWTKHYSTMFLAYYVLITVEHDNSRFEDMSTHIDAVLQQPLTLYDKAMVMELKVNMFVSQSRPYDAVKCVLPSLLRQVEM